MELGVEPGQNSTLTSEAPASRRNQILREATRQAAT